VLGVKLQNEKKARGSGGTKERDLLGKRGAFRTEQALVSAVRSVHSFCRPGRDINSEKKGSRCLG